MNKRQREFWNSYDDPTSFETWAVLVLLWKFGKQDCAVNEGIIFG